jgi:hypothetical protein
VKGRNWCFFKWLAANLWDWLDVREALELRHALQALSDEEDEGGW